MTDKTEPDGRLDPCPFCGAGETHIHTNRGAWSGMGFGQIISVEVRHWCPQDPGQPSRCFVRIGRDEASAIAAWNRRAPVAAAQPVALGGIDVTLDEDQAGLLRDMLGDRGEYPEALPVRLMSGPGHSGHGLYAAQAEYLDEGAVLLAAFDAQPAQGAAERAVPAGWPTNEMIEAGRKAAESHGPLLGNGQSLWHIFHDMLAAAPATAQDAMALAESVGLIGPASRIGDLHAAIQRYHDLICVNATIKAARMAAEVIAAAAPATPASPTPAAAHASSHDGGREAFERHATRRGLRLDRDSFDPANYCSRETQAAWSDWPSIAAAPQPAPAYDGHDYPPLPGKEVPSYSQDGHRLVRDSELRAYVDADRAARAAAPAAPTPKVPSDAEWIAERHIAIKRFHTHEFTEGVLTLHPDCITNALREGLARGCAAAPQPATAVQEPMFWVRLCSDGLYEGPIHNARIEKVRKQSGAWSPLYLHAAPAVTADAQDSARCINIEAAAIALAEAMDYPWEEMPAQGRDGMRKHAKAVIDAALAAQREVKP